MHDGIAIREFGNEDEFLSACSPECLKNARLQEWLEAPFDWHTHWLRFKKVLQFVAAGWIGLFVYATLILIFGWGFSGRAAGCALAITVLPIVCRTSDVVLRLTPGGLTEASYALGSGQWRTVLFVTLPTARSGLATAVILGTARAIGETSPVLLTAGATGDLNLNPLHGPMMSLPLLAYLSVLQPQQTVVTRGFGAASALLILVVLLFIIARIIGGRGAGQLTARQQRRRAYGSARDLARYTRQHGPAGYPKEE